MNHMQISNRDTITVFLIQNHPKENSYAYPVYSALGILAAILLIANWKRIFRWIRNFKPSECSVSIPGFEIKGTLQYFSRDQEVAWKMYIELATRVSGNELEPNTGLIRETMNSLYTVFGIMREILKNSGLELTRVPAKGVNYTVASLLLDVMNKHLRPFLAKWHPLLLAQEKKFPADDSQTKKEESWGDPGMQCREDLKKLQIGIREYVETLKKISTES